MYKQTGNKNKKLFITGLLLVLAITPFGVSADAQQDLAAQKAVKQQQIDQLNAQIKDYQAQIAQKQKQGASLSNEIALYDMEIQTTQLQIQATNTNVDNTNLQIAETKDQIQQKTTQIDQEKTVLAQLIIQLNEYDNVSTLQLGLGSSNFSDFMDQVEYTSTLNEKVYSLIQQIKDLRQKLQNDEDTLQTNLDQLKALQDQLTQSEGSLNDQKQGKVALLNDTKGQEKNYLKLVSATQSQEAAIQKEIYDLDNQAQGQKGFTKLAPNHGILAWPIDGVITQGYGNTGFTALGYNFHNGLDIAAPAGTPIYAAADGVVNGTGSNSEAAYGNWVTIKHDITKDGHQIITLYGHMRTYVLKVGQVVKKGDLVGYEGNTGDTTRLLYGPDRGYHLHFTVFDAVGFKITPGAYPKVYGPYSIPSGYTYDPNDFL